MLNRLFFRVIFFVMLFSQMVFATGGVPALLPFQGRITDPMGIPINYAVTIKFRIYPPLGTCYIYEETQSVTPTSVGLISVVLGTPANSTGPANSFLNIYSNMNTLSLLDSCGGFYTPATSDWRRVQLVVDGVPMAGMQTIAAAPFSLNTVMLDGLTSNQFIQTSGATLTQANILSLTNGSDVGDSLHTHDSTYVRVDGGNSFTGDITAAQNISAAGRIGIGITVPTADLEIVKASPLMKLTATTGSGGTPTIDFYGGSSKRASIVADEATDGLKIYSGSTLAMDVSSVGNVTFPRSVIITGTTKLGPYTTGQEGPGVGTLINSLTAIGATATGTMWMNSTDNRIRYWNGTTALSVSNIENSVQHSTTFSGDVGGTYNTTSVNRIKGYPIDFAVAPTGGRFLYFDGTNWVAQTLGTIPVTGGGTGVTALTANGVLAMNGMGTQVTSNVLNNGQLIIGSTGAAPVVAGLTAGSGIAITNAAGSITIAANSPSPIGATLATGNIWVGSVGNIAASVPMSGDATLASSGALTLGATGITAGTYSNLTVDAKGRITAISALSAGNISTALTYTPLNKAGDVMGGPIGLNAVATDPMGLVAGDIGKIWYNTTAGRVKYWDGAAAQPVGISGSGVTALNTLVGAQSLVAGTGGTDFNINSAGVTHTFNLPTASAANRGALSAADWTTFNNKLPSALATNHIFVGSAGGVATDVAMSGDATISSTGALTLNTVTIAKGGTNSTATLNNNRLMVSNGGAIVEAGAMTNGQLLVGSTGAAPVVANITGTANRVTVTNGAGTISLNGPQDIHTGATPTFVGTNYSAGTLSSTVADGAAARAFTLNSSNAFTSTAKLLSVQNNGTERFSVVQDGTVNAKTFSAVGGSIYAADTNIAGPTANVDFGTGNVQVLQNASAAALNISGMTSGGAYTLIMADTTSRTYTFGGQCGATAYVPANAATQATKRSIYTLIYTSNVGGGTCFISWVSGL